MTIRELEGGKTKSLNRQWWGYGSAGMAGPENFRSRNHGSDSEIESHLRNRNAYPKSKYACEIEIHI